MNRGAVPGVAADVVPVKTVAFTEAGWGPLFSRSPTCRHPPAMVERWQLPTWRRGATTDMMDASRAAAKCESTQSPRD